MSAASKLVLPGLALIGVTYGFARFAYGLFLPAISQDVALTPSLAGLIGGGAYLGYCMAIIASALLTEALSPRATAALAGMVAAVGMAAIAVAPSPTFLTIAVLLAGMSTGLASPPLAQAVAMRIAASNQARANTVINSGTSVGVAISGPVALAFADGWRGAYLLFAVLAAAVSLWAWLALPAEGRLRLHQQPVKVGRPLLRPAASPLMLAAFSMGVSSAIFWTFAGETMARISGQSSVVISLAWIALGLAGFAGGAAGGLIDRYGITGIHRASLLALALAMLIMGASPSLALMNGLAAGLFGAAYIMLTGVYLVWGVQVFAERPAMGLALPFLTLALGQAAGAPLAGWLIGMLETVAAFTIFAGLALGVMLIRPSALQQRLCSARPSMPQPADQAPRGARIMPESSPCA